MNSRLLALTITAAVALGVAGSASAAKPPKPPWIVKDLGGARGHAIVAGWSSKRKNPNLQSLINKWGKPTRCRTNRIEGTATWKKPSARVEFANWAGAPKGKTLCTHPASAKVQWIRTVGSNWVTDKGLAVGADTSVPPNYGVYDKHPDAQYELEVYTSLGTYEPMFLIDPVWLSANQTQEGEARWDSTVRAIENNRDRIVRFEVLVYAMGD